MVRPLKPRLSQVGPRFQSLLSIPEAAGLLPRRHHRWCLAAGCDGSAGRDEGTEPRSSGLGSHRSNRRLRDNRCWPCELGFDESVLSLASLPTASLHGPLLPVQPAALVDIWQPPYTLWWLPAQILPKPHFCWHHLSLWSEGERLLCPLLLLHLKQDPRKGTSTPGGIWGLGLLVDNLKQKGNQMEHGEPYSLKTKRPANCPRSQFASIEPAVPTARGRDAARGMVQPGTRNRNEQKPFIFLVHSSTILELCYVLQPPPNIGCVKCVKSNALCQHRSATA